METNTSIELIKTPLSKSEQTDLINACVKSVVEGEVNPVSTEIALKALEEVIKSIRNHQDYKNCVMNETSKYGKSFEAYGAKIENCQRTILDFSECGDVIWNEMNAEMEKLKERMKAREKTILTGVDPATGEVLNPPKSKFSSFVKIIFK